MVFPMHRPDRKPRWKRIGFPLAAICVGLLPLVGFEVAARIFGIGVPTEATNPEIGFQATYPLFELNQAAGRFEIAKLRQQYFYPDGFAAKKKPREFRIFCLGGSTVQGRPYSIETSFTTWLELSLKAADPSRDWEAVNCGGISYASYRLVPILKESLAYEPDLFVIYTGHNEFLEARTYGDAEKLGARSPRWLNRLRTYNLLRSAWSSSSPLDEPRPKEILAAEVDALLDYQGGLADYHRDDAWHRHVVRSYRQNLREMIELASDAGVPVVLLNPVSNLKDCPPFKVEPRADLTAKERASFDVLWTAAKESNDLVERIELLEKALAIDDRHAAAHFLLGHAFLERQRSSEADGHLRRARDEDICPLRMIEPLHDALHEVATKTKTPLLDVRRRFEERSSTGIPGNLLLLDHVHPSITGHQMIAEQIVEHLTQHSVVKPRENWRSQREEAYRLHLDKFDTIYFADGKARLEGLIRWTQGRVTKLREASSLPVNLDDADDK
jgi:hypothetical protein